MAWIIARARGWRAPSQRGLGGVQLLLAGEQRANALRYAGEDGHLQAEVTLIEDIRPANESDPVFAALYKETRERARELGERRGLVKSDRRIPSE